MQYLDDQKHAEVWWHRLSLKGAWLTTNCCAKGCLDTAI